MTHDYTERGGGRAGCCVTACPHRLHTMGVQTVGSHHGCENRITPCMGPPCVGTETASHLSCLLPPPCPAPRPAASLSIRLSVPCFKTAANCMQASTAACCASHTPPLRAIKWLPAVAAPLGRRCCSSVLWVDGLLVGERAPLAAEPAATSAGVPRWLSYSAVRVGTH